MAVSDVSPGVFSTPLSSPPSNVAPPSSPLGTVTNEYISQDMEVDSDIHSVDIYSSESEESRLGEDDRGTGSLSTQEKLQAIADLLRQYRWTFKDFLRAWVQEVDNYGQIITSLVAVLRLD
jgi:hypothetical protein